MNRAYSAITFLVLIVFSGGLYGNTYTDSGSDHLWNNSANWSQGVPDIDRTDDGQWANMTVNGTVCIIDATHTGSNAASAGGVYPGCYGGENEMYMTGGELSCSYFNIGRGASDSGSDGYFKITGGAINAQGFKIPNQFDSTGGNITGHVDLHGGTINVTGWFHMGTRVSGVYEGGIGTMDIAGGTLIIAGDYTSTIQDYIDDGWITAYGGVLGGQVNVDYGNLNPGKTTVTAEILVLEMKAHNPSPAQDSNDINTTVNLLWSAGAGAVYHNIYFGTDEQAVRDAEDPNVLPGRGSSSSTSYYASLDPGKTYYWRVDEVNSGHPDSPWTGDVWNFNTIPPLTGDVNYDWVVDIQDLREIALRWLDDNCLLPDWCDGADLNKNAKVDLEDYSIFAQNMGNTKVVEPPYTDYCAMLSQEVQGKKHAFLAGNLVYYIGGKYVVWDKQEDETLGLTHPFYHDLRSRGYGMVQDAETGYGHDLQGWEFYRDTKIAYGTVIIGSTEYPNPVPTAMYWRPDKVICEYNVGGVSIMEEKFIALNDVACSIITSDSPIEIRFNGQSYVNDSRSIQRTSTLEYDSVNNMVHVTEGGTALVRPTEGTDIEGTLMYDGMSTVVSSTHNFAGTYSGYRDGNGRQQYSFVVPCDSSGTSVYWAMDDVYANAVNRVEAVRADAGAYLVAKTENMNNLLNYQIPYFRCSDQDIVDIYYYLWSIYLMYYIDVQEGWEVYPHTQTAVNNFLGMHRFDANFQIKVGAWTADKDYYAYGNVLLWKALLPYAKSGGRLPDNMGQSWFSPYWETAIEHVVGAWDIYEHTGDIGFLEDCYEPYFKPLFWDGSHDIWGAKYDGAECLKKMAMTTGHPEDVDHWHQVMGLDGVAGWLNGMWEKDGVTSYFGGEGPAFYPPGTSDTALYWTGMAYMRNSYFPDIWASLMTEEWAVDSVKGFFGPVPLTLTAMQDFDHIFPNFAAAPDIGWYSIAGMYKHHVGSNANICGLGHLKNYNLEWGIPVAPESYDSGFGIWGDQYSNFNAGKILLILEGIAGIDYSIPDDSFTVCDTMPSEWDFMEVMVPIKTDGQTQWTQVRVSLNQNGSGVEKTISVDGNTRSELNIQPWLEDKTLISAPEGYTNQQPRGHIGYQFGNIKSKTITIDLEDRSSVVSIMPLGDSITAIGNSYRKRLYELLTGDGYVIDMVGTQNSGSFADTDHEGHSGWHADSPAGSDDIVGQIDNWLTLNPADIVLLHIGTNDVSGGGEDPDEVAAILDIIKSKNPSTTVIVARIILRNDDRSPETIAYNDGVEAIVNARILAGDNLMLVNMEDALSYPEDLGDHVHPTVTGYEKMADVWYPAVKSILDLYD